MIDNYLIHYGTKRESGRYPWGSGEVPYQHEAWFLRASELKKEGKTEKEIADALGMSTSELRAKKSIAKAEKRAADSALAYRLKQKGYSNMEIGRRMGINESSVRNLLDPHLKVKNEILNSTAKVIKENVDAKGFIDVGAGVEHQLGVSRTKMKAAIALLKEQGYSVYYVYLDQINNPGKKTTTMIIAPPGTSYSDVMKNQDKIHLIEEYSEDGGLTYLNIEPPKSVNSKRVAIRYAEDGGKDKDGVIEIRRGVEDISLGQSRYAQVRIAVDDSHFLKGMAVYSDDLPDGVDILFNTNKHKGTPMMGEKDNSVLKPFKNDPDNPFGSTIKQRHYIDKNGKDQLSAINIVSEEGDWGNWKKRLSSQFLSKQDISLARKQLDLSYKEKLQEYEEISSLTNPSVKKILLESFADDCDSSSVNLKAAALPRTASHVILPFPDMKENEIYAPNYRNGEKVVLIRYPHGGKFEIPELTVNNKHKEANSLIKNAIDAVGINAKVAERLSGADFDGDTVLVIPNNNRSIKTSPALKGLKNFDPKESYPGYEGMPKMKEKTKQTEMGKISNLITDMTLQGATDDEIARAVRHSMVVIDAEKHNLNYKQSYIDNGIPALKKKYQGSERSGASTLISRAKSEIRVPERKETHKIDPNTGKKVYSETGSSYINKKGQTIFRQTKSTRMSEVDDAYLLSSGTAMEGVYADYANKLKALSGTARKESYSLKGLPYSPTANKTYSKEVSTLNSKLNIAEKNQPYERRAQLLANITLKAKRESNPDMTADEAKKIGAQALASARVKAGAHKKVIGSEEMPITDKEWEAIQAGAITPTKLDRILNNADLDKIKERATPRSYKTMTPAKIALAKAKLKSGFTQAEVAEALGISVTTLRNNL